MADHRAEQIMKAFVALLNPLPTTSDNIMRDRPYDIESGVSTALSVYEGIDDPLDDDDQVWPFHDSWLTIYVDIHAAIPSDTPISETLNLIRKEITIALMPQNALGLGFVHDLRQGVADDPEEGVGDKPIAKQRTEWKVKYRCSRTDPSA